MTSESHLEETVDVLTENAACPSCGSRRLSREDVIEQHVKRRIERIEDTEGIYGLRAFASGPDRPGGGSGRRGHAISCDDCNWWQRSDSGDVRQSPGHQDLLRSLLDA